MSPISDADVFAANAVAERAARRLFSVFSSGTASVYTEIVPNCQKRTLQAIIRGKVASDVVIHSDKWRGYDGLVDVGFAKHLRVNHSDNQFAVGSESRKRRQGFWWRFAFAAA